MNSDEKRVLIDALTEERDGYQKILREMRHDKLEKRILAQSEYDKFASRTGEISLAVAAAITPVLILANNPVAYREFLIAGIFTYILIGVLSLLRVKQSVETKIDSFSSMNIDLERDVESITHNINKLIWNANDKAYQSEYINSKKQFIENNSKAKEGAEKLSYFLDVMIGGFLLATFLAIRTVWLFDTIYYLLFGLLIGHMFGWITVKSIIRTKINQVERSNLIEKYEKVKKDYLDWQDKEVFKK